MEKNTNLLMVDLAERPTTGTYAILPERLMYIPVFGLNER